MDPTTESLIAIAAAGLHSEEDFEEQEMSEDPDGAFLLKRDATRSDYAAAREQHRAQIIDGDLWVFAPASGGHQQAAVELGTLLAPARMKVDGSGWVILPDINLKLSPRDLFSPDFSGWRRSRMPERPNATYFEIAPDWVCEILSSSTQRFDKGKKREVYARSGVEHLWFVDPRSHVIDVYALAGNGNYTYMASAEQDDKIALAPFLDIELDLARLWAR